MNAYSPGETQSRTLHLIIIVYLLFPMGYVERDVSTLLCTTLSTRLRLIDIVNNWNFNSLLCQLSEANKQVNFNRHFEIFNLPRSKFYPVRVIWARASSSYFSLSLLIMHPN